MNIHLVKCEEWNKGKFNGILGEVLLRCNNILYIRESEEDSKDEGNDENVKMDNQ